MLVLLRYDLFSGLGWKKPGNRKFMLPLIKSFEKKAKLPRVRRSQSGIVVRNVTSVLCVYVNVISTEY